MAILALERTLSVRQRPTAAVVRNPRRRRPRCAAARRVLSSAGTEGERISEPAQRRWTVGEFFAWQKDQPLRYELVGGFPVRLMAGATNVHDDIVVNLIAELREQLRGQGRRPFTGDGSIETLPGQIRRPDAGVDCGRRDPNATVAAEPRLVAEILSPSTRDFDTFEKLEEYKAVASLEYLLVIEPNAPEVVMWSRGADSTWERRLMRGIDGRLDLPAVGVSLTLAVLYDGIEFPPRPRLVPDDREPME